MRGTVSRFIGEGVGFARLVDVSNVSVFELVDMAEDLAAKRTARKEERAVCMLYLTQC